MIVKIFKGVWLFSLLVTVAVLMYIYASLPETLQVGANLEMSRNGVFYTALIVLTMLTAFIFIISRLPIARLDYFLVWFYGLVIFLHLFVIVALQFINLYNGLEKFDYDRIGVIIYGSLAMVVVWFSLWPVYYLLQKLSPGKAGVPDAPQ